MDNITVCVFAGDGGGGKGVCGCTMRQAMLLSSFFLYHLQRELRFDRRFDEGDSR